VQGGGGPPPTRVSPASAEEAQLRVLITGVNGFAGSHLADLLAPEAGIELWGAGRGRDDRIAQWRDRLPYRDGDLTDAGFASDVVAEAAPDRVYHLAGQAFGPASWDDPWQTLETNLRSQLNVLRAVSEQGAAARILVVGSIEAHGTVDPAGLPIVETTPMRPVSPYGVSKAAQDLLGLQYFLSHGLAVVRVRPANHIGPRQDPAFVVSSFARQIAEIEAGRRAPVLEVGNLAAERDFTDVRDMVRAYRLALEQGEAGEDYVIGSGSPVAVSRVVELLLEAARVPIEVRPDPARLRPSDNPVSYCDAAKLRARTGWEPSVPLAESLADTLDYWRTTIGGGR